MRQVAICDDEKVWRDILMRDIGKWAKAVNREISFAEFSSGRDIIRHIRDSHQVDVLFLDIEFGDKINGIEAAKQLRKMGSNVPIIFVTGYPAHAKEGYMVDAIGFLEKDYRYEHLIFYLEKVVKITTPVEPRTIVIVDTEKKSIRIPVDEIVYAESHNHEVTVHTRRRLIRTRMTLNNLLKKLETDAFVQVHKSYIVSIKDIQSFKETYPSNVIINIVEKGKFTEISVGRSYLQNVQQAYAETVMEDWT